MAIWWSSLSVLSKILWGVTLAATLVFIIQSVLTFIGADMDSNTDFDMDASDSATSSISSWDSGGRPSCSRTA